jgi:hypothetical protein
VAVLGVYGAWSILSLSFQLYFKKQAYLMCEARLHGGFAFE